MKRILYIFICIFFIIIATFSLKKAIFMDNLKKSLKGVVVNLGDFGDFNNKNEFSENKKYIVLDYTKNKILKSKKYSEIYDSNNENIFYKKDTSLNEYNILELNLKTENEQIINKNMYIYNIKNIYNDTIIFSESEAFFKDKKSYLFKGKELLYISINNTYLYYLVVNKTKQVELDIYTKYHEHLRYDENLKNKIWDLDKNKPSQIYSDKDFKIDSKYLAYNSNVSYNSFTRYDGEINTSQYITKDKKYKIYFKKKQGYWDKRYLTLYVYAEEISTHKKLLLYKGSKVYYDEGMFNNEEFKIIKNNVYNWFIY